MDLAGEPIEVQAAYEWLSEKHSTLWMDWDISHEDRRLLAARKCAEVHDAIEKKLTSNDFRPV